MEFGLFRYYLSDLQHKTASKYKVTILYQLDKKPTNIWNLSLVGKDTIGIHSWDN